MEDLTELVYRVLGADAMYNVTKGSANPFGSFEFKSLASITSIFKRNSGASFVRDFSNNSSCASWPNLNASCTNENNFSSSICDSSLPTL